MSSHLPRRARHCTALAPDPAGDAGPAPSPPCSGCAPYGEELVEYPESLGVSSTVWVLSDTWAPPLLADRRTMAPSPPGRFFRDHLFSRND